MTTTAHAETPVDPLWWSWEGVHGGWVTGAALTAVRDGFAGGRRPVRSLTTHFLTPDDCAPLDPPVAPAPFARQPETRPAAAGRPLAGGPRAELVARVRLRDGRAATGRRARVVRTRQDGRAPGARPASGQTAAGTVNS
ncbi:MULTISPECIES: hypothetical protein [Streptomyces]|uniref:Uncharacterized protein n=1 Tax=Streptomyces fimbriatus TaxID=68197 RepID=A0ABW0DFY6_STRFI